MTFSNGYSYRRKILIDHTKVSGTADLSNFPYRFSETIAELKTVANGGKCVDGNDIRFELTDGTKLSHSIDKYSATTGEIIAHIKIPTLYYASDTEIYLYYGKTGAGTETDSTNVWDSNYKAVFHLGDGSTLSVADETSNGNNLTNNSATAAAGKINGCIETDGSSTYAGKTAAIITTTGNWSLECWFNPDVVNLAEATILCNGGETGGYGLTLKNARLNALISFVAWCDTGYDCSAGTWYHVVATRDTSTLKVYVNGEQLAPTFGNAPNNPVAAFTIGVQQHTTYYRYFDGKIDEVRVSNIARSADWIKTSYNVQSSTAHTTYAEEIPITANDTNNLWNDFLEISYRDYTRAADDDLSNWLDTARCNANSLRVIGFKLEVLVRSSTGQQIDINDSLNNWNDSIVLSGEVSVGDNLATWDDFADNDYDLLYVNIPPGYDVLYLYDSVLIDFLVYTGILTKSVNDTLDEWNDSRNFQLTGLLQETNEWSEEDYLRLSDSINIGFLDSVIEVSDSLDYWNDTVGGMIGMPEAFDSNMYNWGDNVTTLQGDALTVSDILTLSDDVSYLLISSLLPITVGDTLTLSDAVSRVRGLNKLVSDFLVISERVSTRYDASKIGADTLVLSDILIAILETQHSLDDTLSISDSVSVGLFIDLTISVVDTISLSDAVTNFNSTSDVSYLRRYLNDVPR